MHFLCIVTVFAYVFSVIPLSFATISVVTPVTAATCEPRLNFLARRNRSHTFCILSAASPDNAIENLGASAAPPFTWNVDVNIGTTVVISVQDSTGDTGRSSPFTITHRCPKPVSQFFRLVFFHFVRFAFYPNPNFYSLCCCVQFQFCFRIPFRISDQLVGLNHLHVYEHCNRTGWGWANTACVKCPSKWSPEDNRTTDRTTTFPRRMSSLDLLSEA
ncbi:hypothetical protein B0H14DRAFT_124882 [Mycena olivaceomarginata]|nr:hypothetical protein B0H14DRAFT_124882 [Mycena olivaceomarginata]